MSALEAWLKRYPIGTERAVWHPPRALVPGLSVSYAGVERQTSPEYRFNGLERKDDSSATLQYTFAGEGRLRYEKTEYRVKPGQAMLLFFPHDHCYWLPGASWEFFFIAFTGHEAARVWQELITVAGPIVELDAVTPAIQAAVGLCERVFAGDIRSPYEAAELAYSFAMRLVEAIVPAETKLPVRSWANPEFVTRVEAFCLKNLGHPIGVNDMARIAKMSRYHFTRRFEKIVGISPGKYLTNLRLDEARRLLQRQGSNGQTLTVKEAAERCGFSDARHFARIFHDKYGLLPSALRPQRK